MARQRNLTPNPVFCVLSPDEVAETMEGVPPELSYKLWSLVSLYDKQPRSEVPDDFAERSVKKYWSKFTLQEQITLNILAVKHNKQWSA